MNETADPVLLESVDSPTGAAEQDAAWRELVAGPLADPELPFEAHWDAYQRTFTKRSVEDGPPVAWAPDAATLERANVSALMQEVGVTDLAALHAWSVANRAEYWTKAIQAVGAPFDEDPESVLDDAAGAENAVWLKGAKLNAAQMCFEADPLKPAIVAGREGSPERTTWTYRELEALADRVSHGLGHLNLRAGDAVALYMPMTAECVAAYLGIVQAGLAVVSIPDSFAPPEVATRLRLGDAKAIITVASFLRAGRNVPMAHKAIEASEETPGAPPCVVVGDLGNTELRYHDLAWEDFLGDEGVAFEPVPCDPDAVTNILFSSGTTGEPKAIPWTHCTPLKAAVDGYYHQDVHADDVVAWPTNIGWMMGPWLIYASLGNGATMALYEGAPAGEGFLNFLDESGVTVLGVVPAIVRAWMQGGAKPGRLPKVRVYSSTGEASNPHDYLYLMSLSGYRAPVIEYCGGTEVGGGHLTGTVVQPASPATFTTPALGLDFVLVDDDAVVEGPGMGELFLVPPSLGLSQRLLNKDHHEVYFEGCPPGPGGAVLRRHGDEVERLAGPGVWYRAQGRADDTMNLGGIKVGSIELETVMNGHEHVSETAAVAVPPAGGGADRLIVFFVPAPGVKPDPKELKTQLQSRIKAHLNPLFHIHDVVLARTLPRTASNKVMRKELRGQYKG